MLVGCLSVVVFNKKKELPTDNSFPIVYKSDYSFSGASIL